MNQKSKADVHHETLEEQLRNTLTEGRMVLPGIQATLGFQLIAVFNDRFKEDLSHSEQSLHVVAFLCVALAAGLMMTPAAYHRIAEFGRASERFIRTASRFLEWAMVPLAFGLAIDTYLISRLVFNDAPLALAIGAIVMVVLLSLWFGFPHWMLQRRKRGRQAEDQG
jgi:hypothetical protein